MAIRKVLQTGDPVLRKKSKEVTAFNDRLGVILQDMAETMYKEDGVGLAAPQVGILKRICVVDVGHGLYEFINPVILESSGEQIGPEGCLSVEGVQGDVIRPYYVRVKALDRHGNEFEVEAEEFFARAICHEIDHLDGILFTDKIMPGSRMLRA